MQGDPMSCVAGKAADLLPAADEIRVRPGRVGGPARNRRASISLGVELMVLERIADERVARRADLS